MHLNLERIKPRGKWSADAAHLCGALFDTGADSVAFALIDCLQELGWTFSGAVWAAREVLGQRGRSEAGVLPARLRALRERAGLTVADLARATGLSRAALYNLENGDSRPTWDAVQRLADALGVSTDDFRTETAV